MKIASKFCREKKRHYLDELVDGELELKRERFLCLESLTGVSSTMRLANNSASSSQPAIAAADLNLGDKRVAMFWTLESANGIFWLLGLRFCSPLTAIRTLTQYRQLFWIFIFIQRSTYFELLCGLATLTAIFCRAIMWCDFSIFASLSL